MAAVVYTRGACEDLDRLTRFLLESHPGDAEATAGLIEGALAILENHPLIGKAVEDGFRELLISRGRSGYVALYEYREAADEVVVHGIWRQREAGLGD